MQLGETMVVSKNDLHGELQKSISEDLGSDSTEPPEQQPGLDSLKDEGRDAPKRWGNNKFVVPFALKKKREKIAEKSRRANRRRK